MTDKGVGDRLLSLLLLLLLCCGDVFVCATAANTRPTVGILTQKHSSAHTYIAASYVKWVESAGARAVPLFYDAWSGAELGKVLQSVNGVLLPGGGADFVGAYWQALQTIFDYAVQANKMGLHYPIWGTCLGVCSRFLSLTVTFALAATTPDVCGCVWERPHSLRSCCCSAQTTPRSSTAAWTARTWRCRWNLLPQWRTAGCSRPCRRSC